ncbi:MAG: HlyD family efflux transporter periplasmic adaptor subunit [Anaerolineae bacterium]|nr:HlyD family efflux transporter periplasmic adaptor subunit [Anaerolineae bacterium]
MKNNRNLSLLATILLFLSACTANSAPFGFGGATSTPEATPTPLPTPVQIFQSTVTADGEIVLPLPPQKLSFPTGLSGTIEDVYVVAGQAVKQGDRLAKVYDDDLQTALAKAEASLELTQAQIANEAAPALAGDISEAQGNLAAAQAELQRLRDLPSDEAITQAAADLRLREVELRQAQEAYDAIAYAEGVGMSPQAADLQTATLNYERAQAVYTDATKPANEAELVAAQSKVGQSQNALEKLLTGLRPEAESVNEARLKEAEIQVEEAKANLAKSILYAPWDGVVTAVDGAPGVPLNNASITLAQIEPLRFATNNFSERNLDDIEVGDEATIYLKTYANTPFPAVIQRIDLESTAKDGDTALFTVYFDFNGGEFELRPGMTGRVEINIEPRS